MADHIALHEAGLRFEHEKVDLKAKKTESGEDFAKINPKGYVPALLLDSGAMVTENVAILDWIAHQAPALVPSGDLGHTRLLEALAYISTELHKNFKPLFAGGSDEEKQKARETITKRLNYLADQHGRRLPVRRPVQRGRRLSVRDAAVVARRTTSRYPIRCPRSSTA